MQSHPKTKKVLLVGQENVGRTSMFLILFGAHPGIFICAKPTVGGVIGRKGMRLIGNLSFEIMSNRKYREVKSRNLLLENVEAVIYMLQADSDTMKEDLRAYEAFVQEINKFSQGIQIFLLVHKIDKIASARQDETLMNIRNNIAKLEMPNEVKLRGVYGTSIWDDTLYKAWSQISQILTPNVAFLRDSLDKLANIGQFDEVILFDKQTFAIIFYNGKDFNKEARKFEGLSVLMKQFQMTWYRINRGTGIKSMAIQNSKFTANISEFTQDTYLMIITFDARIQPRAIDLSVRGAKRYFEKITTETISH